MPVDDTTKRFEVESPEPIIRFDQIRPYLWWKLNITDEDEIIQTIRGFTSREMATAYTPSL